MSQEKTKWFIETARRYGIEVVKTDRAPNGGEVIYFDFPKTGYYNPYFMIWTGDENSNRKDYRWHPEFGHWYMPKNAKERKQYPPTIHFKEEQLEEKIKDYAQRKGS
jgi:hypothetical protein